jgi:carbon-monoxide dehydrogenase small subunit
MLMNAYAFLRSHPHPSRADIVGEMDNNLCRCGAHNRILLAIASAAQEMKGGL